MPMASTESVGRGEDRADCMRKFRAAWEQFAADEANLTAFLDMKGKQR